MTNTWTTGPYYSRFHLNLVEEVVLAIVSDEFALGPLGGAGSMTMSIWSAAASTPTCAATLIEAGCEPIEASGEA